MTSTKTYVCATPGCGRSLKNDHWVFSVFTGSRFCYPGDGCTKWTTKQRRKARATAMYERLREMTEAELVALAQAAEVEVADGYSRQQTIATLIESASAARRVFSPGRRTRAADGASDKPSTRRKEPSVATKDTAKQRPAAPKDEATTAAAPATDQLHSDLLVRVKGLKEANVDVVESPTGKYEILKVDGKTIGYVNPSRTGVRVEARGTVAELPANQRDKFVQRKPHLVATVVAEKGDIARAIVALTKAATKVAQPETIEPEAKSDPKPSAKATATA